MDEVPAIYYLLVVVGDVHWCFKTSMLAYQSWMFLVNKLEIKTNYIDLHVAGAVGAFLY